MELIPRYKAVKQNTQDDKTYEMVIRCISYILQAAVLLL